MLITFYEFHIIYVSKKLLYHNNKILYFSTDRHDKLHCNIEYLQTNFNFKTKEQGLKLDEEM